MAIWPPGSSGTARETAGCPGSSTTESLIKRGSAVDNASSTIPRISSYADFGWNSVMALQPRAWCSIHHENWMMSGVEKNRVCCLWTNARLHQPLLVQFECRLSQHRRQRSTISLFDKSDEFFPSFHLLPKVSRWAHEQLEFFKLRCPNSVEAQAAHRWPAETRFEVIVGAILTHESL